MDTKEKHIRENESSEKREIRGEQDRLSPIDAMHLKANGKRQFDKSTRKINKLWLWLGVLVLCFILIWWLFSIGTFADLFGLSNG